MSLRCGLFDSTEIIQTVDGYPQGNKAETADFFAHALAGLSGNGIPPTPADAFKVTANGSMAVSVAPGYCYINGYHAWDDETATITISNASAARSVYVSMRLNLLNGEITLISDTAFTRAESIYDLALARIDIPANSAAITADMVTDLRGNSNYCGVLQKITDGAATEIWNYLSGNVQPINLGGTGATTVPAAKDNLGRGKVLYTGTLAAGESASVPGIHDYYLYRIKFSGDNTTLLAVKWGTQVIRGIGGYATESNMWINTVGFSVSGETVTLGAALQVSISTGTSHTITTSTKTIQQIVGLL